MVVLWLKKLQGQIWIFLRQLFARLFFYKKLSEGIRAKSFLNFRHFKGKKFLTSFLILANFDDFRTKFDKKLLFSCFLYDKFLIWYIYTPLVS